MRRLSVCHIYPRVVTSAMTEDNAISNCESKTPHRLKTLDVYKGMAIMGVIITHLVLLQNGTDGTNNDPSPVVQFMFSGLIMFMVVSGYFYKPGKSYVQNIKRRVVPLIVVYFVSIIVLTTIVCLYMLALGYDLSSYSFIDELLGSMFTKGSFLDVYSTEYEEAVRIIAPYEVTIMIYYLAILSGGYLIFYAIADRVLKDWRFTVAAILILFGISSAYICFVHIQLPFLVQLFPMVAGFLLFGALLAKYRFVEFLETGYRDKRFWILLLVFVAIAAACLVLLPANTDLYRMQIGDYGIFSVYTFALTSLSCGLVQLYIALLFSKIPGISHLFNLMGENVLYLYLLHMAVAKMLIAPFVHLDTTVHIPLDFYPALGLAFLTIAVILVLAYIYRRIRPDIIAKVKGKGSKAEGA